MSCLNYILCIYVALHAETHDLYHAYKLLFAGVIPSRPPDCPLYHCDSCSPEAPLTARVRLLALAKLTARDFKGLHVYLRDVHGLVGKPALPIPHVSSDRARTCSQVHVPRSLWY